MAGALHAIFAMMIVTGGIAQPLSKLTFHWGISTVTNRPTAHRSTTDACKQHGSQIAHPWTVNGLARRAIRAVAISVETLMT